MDFRRVFPVIVSSLLPLLGQGAAEGWDARQRARGWAYHDVDGAFVFLEPARKAFMLWDPVAGLRGSRPAPVVAETLKDETRAEVLGDPHAEAVRMLYGAPTAPVRGAATTQVRFPERWLLDPRDGLWSSVGTTLMNTDLQGKVLTKRTLPAPVADLVRVQDGFYICYRTTQPYLQKFDWNGNVVWSHPKSRPSHPVVPVLPLHRIVATAEGSVLLAELGNLSFTVLGPGTSGQMFFTQRGAVADPLPLGREGRGPMVFCPSRQAVLAIFSAQQAQSVLPEVKGLALGCLDLAKGTIRWSSTGLAEGHLLVGVDERGAVFTSPEGGIAVVPVP